MWKHSEVAKQSLSKIQVPARDLLDADHRTTKTFIYHIIWLWSSLKDKLMKVASWSLEFPTKGVGRDIGVTVSNSRFSTCFIITGIITECVGLPAARHRAIPKVTAKKIRTK